MHVGVAFQDDRLDLEVPEDRLVGVWEGPRGVASSDLATMLAEALEHPHDFPPLRQAVVPGDHVAIALGVDVPEAPTTIAAVCRVLESAGVVPADMIVLAEPGSTVDPARDLPLGVRYHRHDPDDRTRIAYLAATEEGRRVYLDCDITDADFVVPIGRITHDPVLGHGGPWGVIFPGLSDADTRQAYRVMASQARRDRKQPCPALRESVEVSWLLGCQFQLGLVPGVTGVADVVAGLGATVVERGTLAVDRAWGFRAGSRAELVVVGIGRPGIPAGIVDVARGLANATRLVQHGGKIVVLSHAAGEVGPAVRRLLNVDDPRAALARLKGNEGEADSTAASQIAHALAWADVYLLSNLGGDLVEELSMIPLDRPEEARRLAASSGSCLVVSQADVGHSAVVDEFQ
jgi:lactate racemase